MPEDEATAVLSFIDNVGNVAFMCWVRFTGKRRLYLAIGLGIFLSSLTISIYTFIVLPSGFTSFNLEHQSFHMEHKSLAYIPLVCLYLWSFFSFAGG